VLSTHSFLAPGFYENHGYTVADEFPGYPVGGSLNHRRSIARDISAAHERAAAPGSGRCASHASYCPPALVPVPTIVGHLGRASERGDGDARREFPVHQGGGPKLFKRSDLANPVMREFSAQCGTHILARSPGLPGAVLLKVGTFDDPSVYGGPQMVIFTIDKQTFHHVPEGVMTFERAPGWPPLRMRICPEHPDEQRGAVPATTRERGRLDPRMTSRIRTAIAVSALVVWLACDLSSHSGAAPGRCEEAGAQCQLPEGPLGVCERTTCATAATPPCFVCVPQH